MPPATPARRNALGSWLGNWLDLAVEVVRNQLVSCGVGREWYPLPRQYRAVNHRGP